MKAIVLCARSPICHSCFRCSVLLLSLVFLLVCFAPCQMALAVSPAPDGGYAGNNTAEGTSALFSLTSGADNTAIGFQALFRNTSGTYNSGEGFRALFSNTTGVLNTATGVQALNSNTIGAQNTATGVNALFSNTTASYNTANGTSALFHNTTGSQNTATGVNALANNTTAIGEIAGLGITTHSNIIAIGQGVSGKDSALGEVDNACYIGNISGANVASGTAAAVFVDVDGKLGTVSSSRRFKKEIKPMDKASEVILALKPVTFQYNYDKKSRPTPEFGLIAEEVAEVNPDLVVRDKNGEVMTVRYEQVNAMLLNEFLKEHHKVEEQQANIAELKSTVAQQQKGMQVLTAQLKEQASQIQKVSAQLELNKRAPRTVANK